MDLMTMLSTGPVLAPKSDGRFTSDPEQQEADVLEALPGQAKEVAKRAGWSLPVVRAALTRLSDKGLVTKTYVGGNKGGKRYRYERAKP